MKILTSFLIICFFSPILYGQQSASYFYLSPSVGRTSQSNSDDSSFNSGLSLSMLDWPNFYSISFSAQYRFPFPEGNWENQEEFCIKYNYLFQPFGWKKIFISFGSGVAMVNRIHKIFYVTDEISKDKKSIKLGIPVEWRIGFLYPQNSLRLVDFTIFKVFNSVSNYTGWKLGFNITL